MKLNKIFMLTGIAAAMFCMSACSDDEDYVPGKQAGSENVYFSNDEGSVALDLSENKFTFEVSRENGTGELTVPLEILQKPDFFTVPTSVTFAAGETQKTLEVTIGEGMENFVEYALRIRIPEKYTQPYKDDAETPLLNMTILKEDFAPWAEGTFTDNILFEQSWDQTLEYSPIKDMYRLPNLIAAGTHFYFKWDGTDAKDQKIYFCNANGEEVSSFNSGYVHASYGMIVAYVLNEDNWMGYNSEDKTFYFPLEFKVSAGSFGSSYETFTITNRY